MQDKINSIVNKLDSFGTDHQGFLFVIVVACGVVVTISVVKMAFMPKSVRQPQPRLGFVSKPVFRKIPNGNPPPAMDLPRIPQPVGFGRTDLANMSPLEAARRGINHPGIPDAYKPSSQAGLASFTRNPNSLDY